ncbi:hypothetical protein Lalb_Chr06g0172091 [Lupinus albus]|uniref:Uncharacterized protein n=1 Tax=Lupinus albus TaxID=3870 RepID=A0A6A4QEU0_LUPAL|nr:hypothetical protein Lalb_Chr06g0172091 [Lupinus albus]
MVVRKVVYRLAHKSIIRTTTCFFMTKRLYEFFRVTVSHHTHLFTHSSFKNLKNIAPIMEKSKSVLH